MLLISLAFMLMLGQAMASVTGEFLKVVKEESVFKLVSKNVPCPAEVKITKAELGLLRQGDMAFRLSPDSFKFGGNGVVLRKGLEARKKHTLHQSSAGEEGLDFGGFILRNVHQIEEGNLLSFFGTGRLKSGDNIQDFKYYIDFDAADKKLTYAVKGMERVQCKYVAKKVPKKNLVFE